MPQAQAQSVRIRQIRGKFHPNGKISLSPNGRWLVASSASPGYDNLDALLMDLPRGHIVKHLNAAPFAWTPDGLALYGIYKTDKGDSCTGLEIVEMPSLRRSEFYRVLPHDIPLHAAFSLDGREFVISSYIGFSRYNRGVARPALHFEQERPYDAEIAPDARLVSLDNGSQFQIVGTASANVAWKQLLFTGYSEFHGWDDTGTFAKAGVYALKRLYFSNRREGYTFFDARSHQVIGHARVSHSTQEDVFAAGRLWHWNARKLQVFAVPSGRLLGQVPMKVGANPCISADGRAIYSLDDQGRLWKWTLPDLR